MPNNPAAATSQPTFRRRNVKGVLVVVLAVALAGGIAAAADSPTAPANFVGISPVRVLDTRIPIGVPAKGPIPPDTTIDVSVAGLNGIPADATSVAANVTIDGDASAVSFLTVWPTGQTRPLTSVNNVTPGSTSPSAGIFQLGTDGKLSVYNFAGNANVIIDVTGYYLPASPPVEYGLVSVFVDRGSGPTRYATFSGPIGSPAGTTIGGTFRFSCQITTCKISWGAAVISDQAGNAVVHPRLLIQKQDTTSGAASTYCEYADGADNNAGLDQIPRVPTLTDAATVMRTTPLDMGIGGSLDCNAGQTYPANGVVTEIWVPQGYYNVAGTFAFGPNPDLGALPPGP